MRKHNSVGLVFHKIIYVSVLSALILSACAGIAAGQTWGGYANTPGGQYQYAPYGQSSAQADAQQYLPADYPQTIQVPGLDMTGLIAGDNNVSYAIKVASQDNNNIYFQVQAFCVYNSQSQYAILHTLKTPISGVIDRQKNTLQIDFSKLPDALDSVKVIDVSDVDRVLMQSKDVMVLNTVMSVDSSDSSSVKFSISDMSLLQPDGVLTDLSLPGPVQGVYDIGDSRFSTLAYPELANLFQQNYLAVQQNTFISVVNQVNVVNVVNVANIGGYGYGLPFGDYGSGYYGGYGYGGYPAPYTDPLPMPAYDTWSGPPLHVPDKVRTYGDVPARVRGHMDTAGGDRSGSRYIGNGRDNAGRNADTGTIGDTRTNSGSRLRTPGAATVPDTAGRMGISSAPARTPDASHISSSSNTGRDRASGSASRQLADANNGARQGTRQTSDPATQTVSRTKAPASPATKPETATNTIRQTPASSSGHDTRQATAATPKQTTTRTQTTKPTVQHAPQTKTSTDSGALRSAAAQPVRSSGAAPNKQSAPAAVKSAPKTVASQPVRSSGAAPNRQSAPAAVKSTPKTVNKAPQTNTVKSPQHTVSSPSRSSAPTGSSASSGGKHK